MQGSITTPGSIALAQAQAQAQVPAKAPLAGQVSTMVTTSTTTTVAKTVTVTRPTGVSFKKDVPVSRSFFFSQICYVIMYLVVNMCFIKQHMRIKSIKISVSPFVSPFPRQALLIVEYIFLSTLPMHSRIYHVYVLY